MVNMLSITLLLSLCATIYGHNEAESVTVVVNHVRLYKGNNNTDIEYRYFDGDAVELICHTPRYGRHVRMIYDYVNESQDQSRDATISWMVGLRLNLRAAHNGSRVTCRAWNDYSRLDTKVNITLILENSVEDVINLKINGLAVRPQSTHENTNLVVLFQKSLGYWAKFVYMAFECGSNNKDIVLESYQYECGNRKETFEKLSSRSRVMTDYSKFLTYVARNKTTMQPIRIIDIRFEEMPNPYNTFLSQYPNLRVTLNGAPSDDMIELYAVEGLNKIYYYCEEDLSVVLNCSRREQNNERQIDYLVFDDEGKYVSETEEYDDYTTQIDLEETHSNFITKKIKLTSEDYVKELYCRRKNYDDEVNETIRVQLRRITTKTEAKKRITGDLIKVLVNRAKIYEGNNNSNIEYRYLEGDKVDVTCVGIKNICPISMTYYYVDKHLVDEDSANMSLSADPSSPGVGLRVTLNAAHNGSYVSCKCFSEGIQASAKLTFILDNDIKDVMNLKINGLVLRPQNTPYSKYTVYYLQHEMKQWVRSGVLFFNYNVTNDDVILKSYRYNCSCKCQKPALQRHYLNSSTTGTGILTDYEQNLFFEAQNKTSLLPLQTADIRFELIDNLDTDLPSLSLKGLLYNNLIKLYSWNGDSFYYYNYEDGDNVTMACYTDNKSYDYYISFEGEDTKDSSYGIQKHIQLTTADNNRTLECKLKKWIRWYSTSDVKKTVRLLLRQVAENTTKIANDTKADSATSPSTPETNEDNKQTAL